MENSASEIAERLARDADAVCHHYLSKGCRQGRYWIVGDVRNTPGRSLYVRLTGPISGPGAAGNWTDAASGDHGDLLDLIAQGLGLGSIGDAMEEARRFLNLPKADPPVRESRDPAPVGSPKAARRLWAMGQPISGTLAERYLVGRGISGVRNTGALRFHPRCYYWREYRKEDDAPETWPALLAKVTDPDGHLTGLHRTWLDPESAGKAPIDPNRKAMGHLLGHGVRFGTPDDLLAVGEGLETMLSLRMALPGLPAIAALSASHLAALVLPQGTHRLYIAVDRDPAGMAAADAIATRAEDERIEAIRLWPAGNDFNDDLRRTGLAEMRAQLRPQLAAADVARLRVDEAP
ncbi:toprim domain-containing protein [Maribius pontilimi]|uniref:Toprim domain-containing protein n=1 Tax=Palleronia pontilimi TaxID=1964209 RepID=A0A934ICF3_9RHOB|nr:toprim domain-containing protein [Palleronia pontilimi]MBJ3764603.1 toprim domain-containing protein [Palleronia pontilimi]